MGGWVDGWIYIFHNDVVGGYAIGCDEEEVFWRGRRIDVADLTLGKELELGNVRVDQGRSTSHDFGICAGMASVCLVRVTHRVG